MKQVWSSGGGTQSAAIAVLIAEGKLPKPDISIIVDTEREMSSTWSYHQNYIKPMLKEVDVDLVRVKKSEFATVDLFSKKGDKLLLPVFTNTNGSIGKMPTNCSNEWKQRVVRRYCTSLFPDEKEFKIWLGITTDEIKRVKTPTGKWQNHYPLIDLRLSRAAAIKIVENYGLPTPPKSTCYMCPNKSTGDWLAQKENYPGDFNKAVKLDEWIREEADEDFYLHRSGKPLSEIKDDDEQINLFDTTRCDSGYCFT